MNDLALHFLAKMKILVVRDIEREDVEFISRVSERGREGKKERGREGEEGKDRQIDGGDLLLALPPELMKSVRHFRKYMEKIHLAFDQKLVVLVWCLLHVVPCPAVITSPASLPSPSPPLPSPPLPLPSQCVGCRPIASLDHFLPEHLGSAQLVEEVSVGTEKVVKVQCAKQ